MKTIRDYLDSLFLNVPKTAETMKAKEDLLAIMEDHYHELIDQGKSEHEAIGAVISEFGSIDELLQELQVEAQEDDDWQDVIEIDEAFDYWGQIRRFAFSLSLGIAFCISSLGLFLFLVNNINSGIALLGMFLFVALGVGFIISSGMNYSAAKRKLNDRPLAQEVKREARGQLEQYEKSFRFGLILGIIACIISVTPLFLIAYLGSGFALDLFFAAVALGVFFIVYVSIIRTGFGKMTEGVYFISNEDEPGPRATKHIYGENAGKVRFFHTVYWPAIVVVYLVWSIATQSWIYSWAIFVLGGVLQDFFLPPKKNK
jgi:hypothetical protein